MLGGRDFEVGSVQEAVAMRAFKNKQYLMYTNTQILVEAIVYAGNVVASSMSAEGSPPSPDRINDLMAQLRELMFPEMVDEREDRAKKVMKVMEKEIARGPFKVEAMTYEKRGK